MTRKLFLFVVACLALTASSAAAGGGPEVRFSPVETVTTVGESVSIEITVSDIAPEPGLAGYDLVLTFDPSIVRLDSLTDSGFVTTGENLVICVTGSIDNVGGSVNANCTAIPLFGAPGVSTSEPTPLLQTSFTALAPGTSALALSGPLSSPDGTALGATLGTGAITVIAEQPPPEEPTSADASPAPETTPLAVPAAGTGPERGSSPGVIAAGILVAIAVGAISTSLLLLILGRRRYTS